MKKLILILFVGVAALPLFAVDFNAVNFEIDSEIKTQISTEITRAVNNSVIENSKQQSGSYTESIILATIKEEFKFAQQHVERNANMRDRFPNHKFIQEQKIQKQRYANMDQWNIPAKILAYIKANFNLQKIEHVSAVCKYVNETGIDVRFIYGNDEGIIVSYTYTETPEQPSITHKIFR